MCCLYPHSIPSPSSSLPGLYTDYGTRDSDKRLCGIKAIWVRTWCALYCAWVLPVYVKTGSNGTNMGWTCRLEREIAWWVQLCVSSRCLIDFVMVLETGLWASDSNRTQDIVRFRLIFTESTHCFAVLWKWINAPPPPSPHTPYCWRH
jgi:hypothetical protein